MNRQRTAESVINALRRVNLQGTLFGQTVAIRFGLSDSDVTALETLLEVGRSSAGRLSEVMGLTSGAITRVVDRLEQSGYVRRVPDPSDRRRVVIEVVPDKVDAIRQTLDAISRAGADEIGRYTDAQLDLIQSFLTRMEELTREEVARMREPSDASGEGPMRGEHAAPLAGLDAARLVLRSGASEITLRGLAGMTDLHRATFEGAVPTVRVRDGVVSVQYRGMPFDWRKRSADLTLNADIPWDVELHGGASWLDGRLAALDVRSIDVSGGVGRLELALGHPRAVVPIRISGGVNEARIERPFGVGIRLAVAGGAGRVEFDGERLGAVGGKTELTSRGIGPMHFAVDVSGGVSRIEVREARVR